MSAVAFCRRLSEQADSRICATPEEIFLDQVKEGAVFRLALDYGSGIKDNNGLVEW